MPPPGVASMPHLLMTTLPQLCCTEQPPDIIMPLIRFETYTLRRTFSLYFRVTCCHAQHIYRASAAIGVIARFGLCDVEGASTHDAEWHRQHLTIFSPRTCHAAPHTASLIVGYLKASGVEPHWFQSVTARWPPLSRIYVMRAYSIR